MADVINALTAPDNYSLASTIQGDIYDRFVIDVVNQSIFWQLLVVPPSISAGGANWEGNETQMLPGSRTILEAAAGIRFRAVVPAAQIPAGSHQAIVTVRAIPR